MINITEVAFNNIQHLFNIKIPIQDRVSPGKKFLNIYHKYTENTLVSREGFKVFEWKSGLK